ncbi:RHS repeat domain-containing protein [Streptomyces sp. NPDC087903]|uniref:RHS repeat domain-containing protein n=1 Tax=Streptomyces sp. NPDC087903 TaxID=3365819 RepID=UPI00380D2A6F
MSGCGRSVTTGVVGDCLPVGRRSRSAGGSSTSATCRSPPPRWSSTTPPVVTFRHDTSGRVDKITTAEGRVTVFTYDDANRVTSMLRGTGLDSDGHSGGYAADPGRASTRGVRTPRKRQRDDGGGGGTTGLTPAARPAPRCTAPRRPP